MGSVKEEGIHEAPTLLKGRIHIIYWNRRQAKNCRFERKEDFEENESVKCCQAVQESQGQRSVLLFLSL